MVAKKATGTALELSPAWRSVRLYKVSKQRKLRKRANAVAKVNPWF